MPQTPLHRANSDSDAAFVAAAAPNAGSFDHVAAAAAIRQAKITLVAIGVGSGIDTAWLDSISDYSYTVAGGFSQLQTMVESIVKAACTDVDVSVSCSGSSVGVGGTSTVLMTLDNRSAYDVTAAIPFNLTLAEGLALVGVTATANAPPGGFRVLHESISVQYQQTVCDSCCQQFLVYAQA
jgi:hypothetical protein